MPCGTNGLAILATKGTSGCSSAAVSILIGTAVVVSGPAGASTSRAGLRLGRLASCLRTSEVELVAGESAESPVSTRRGAAAPVPP